GINVKYRYEFTDTLA
ncbi:Ail/Lom family outer membrane beta-barrel protein, partial [Escherichia coli]|nr:Ail/Lom family outer membrane beta-barrel protein [Escherichia coli]